MDNQNLPPNPTPQTENVPAQNPAVETPPQSPKSFLSNKIILLVIILLILFGAGGTYLALNSKPKPQPIVSKTNPTSTPTPTPLQAWKVLKTFVDSKENKKYIIQEAKKPYISKTDIIYYNQIYVSSSPEKTIQSVLIVSPEMSGISNSPYISTNDGVKYLVFELLGPGDGQSFVLVDENGRDVRIDLSRMGLGTQIPGMYGLRFGKWINNSINFTINVLDANGHNYEAVFDAPTGKQVGETKQIN